jgi:aerobic carbon-monoxide dehydrogenase medium subunit
MKAPPFDYVRPSSLEDAVRQLAAFNSAGKSAQLMAGGQSMLAMMNLRLSSPDTVIDIAGLEALRGAEISEAGTRFGACVTHAAIEDGRFADPSAGLMTRVAAMIAYRAVRNKGTIGGSLALSDPAGDWVTVMPALDGQIHLVGPAGPRTVAAADFTTGVYETARDPDEILESIEVPRLSRSGRWGFSRFARKAGDFAISIAAAVIDPERDYGRIVLGGLDGPPAVLAQASEALKQRAEHEEIRTAAAADLAEAGYAFDRYRSSVHAAMIGRAVSQVLA